MSIGKDLFNDLGIGYTGLASTWSGSMTEEKEEEIDDSEIPNESLAGTDLQQATFHRLIKSSLEKNKQVDVSPLSFARSTHFHSDPRRCRLLQKAV